MTLEPRSEEALDEPGLDTFATILVEMCDAEILIHVTAAVQVVDDDQDGVTERDDCLLLAAPGGEPTILGSEGTSPGPAERMGRFDQSRP